MSDHPSPEGAAPGKPLTPEARRALEEAAARRAAEAVAPPAGPPETGGPAGPEPTRYGDWERKGIVSDF
ncbi:MAG: DUF1674 domain-containing protein [Alphaproteobacteria bacterium]